MSELKVNKITPKTGTSIQLGESGDTITIPCGATLTNNGTATGFGLSFCTTAKSSPFTATANKGFLINTGSAVTVTLPASPSTGDEVIIVDQTGQASSNNITLGRNGSKIKGACADGSLKIDRGGLRLVYSGSSQGWITATAGNDAIASQEYNVEYLVVAGGGSGGSGDIGGGAGAGGMRFITCATFTVATGTSYPITVGGGGAAVSPSGPCNARGINGSNSTFSTITSAGGGGGGGAGNNSNSNGRAGGSGGGGGYRCHSGGAGNTPPVSPPQGNAGGGSGNASNWRQGGGGGHGTAGTQGHPTPSGTAGKGGEGSPYGRLGPLAPSYGTTGPSPGRYFAGGGSGGIEATAPGGTLTGGSGGGGTGATTNALATAGTTNTGGGGGGGENTYSGGNSGAGGSGIVIIRHATANGGSGGNATGTCGSDTIRVFTGDGTFTA